MDNKKNIIMVSDSCHGGAAVSLYQTMKDIKNYCTDQYSVLWVSGICGKDDAVDIIADRNIHIKDKATSSLYYYLKKFGISKYFGGIDRLSAYTKNVRMYNAIYSLSPDLVHLHNIHEYCTFTILKNIMRNFPVIWTLHDMWALTGYCCYSYECKKYLIGCDSTCVQYGDWGRQRDLPSKEWTYRNKIFSEIGDRLVIVCPSMWMLKQAENRFAGKIRVEYIPYSVDVNIFKPISKRLLELRGVLNLPLIGKIVLLSSETFTIDRKGAGVIKKIVEKTICKDGSIINWVIIGEKRGEIAIKGNFIFVGEIIDKKKLNLFYNVADVFILPTIGDNLPNMLLEASASGTPSVTFNVGGCSEIIQDGVTGRLVECGNGDKFAVALSEILDNINSQREYYSHNCSEYVREKFSGYEQASSYNRIYQEMISDHK